MKKLVVKEFINWLNENANTTVGMMGINSTEMMRDPLSVYIRANDVRRPNTMPTWAKKFAQACEEYPMYVRTNGEDAKGYLCNIIGYQYYLEA